MEVKDAVKTAKTYLSDLLADENMTNLGLEEIEFNDDEGAWDVTLGFSRPWNSSRGPLSTITGEPTARRAYRVIRIQDKDGRVLFVRKREALVD